MAAVEKHGQAQQSKTLFIRNLPYSTTNDELEKIFSDIGPVKTCFVVTDGGTGKSRGFGYVKFTLVEDAENALQTVKKINGRKIGIRYANKKEKKKKFGQPKAQKPEPGTQITAENNPEKLQGQKKPVTNDGPGRAKEAEVSQKQPVKGQKQALNPQNEGKRARLIVRNLSFKCTEDQLRSAFLKHGTVVEARIPEKGRGIKKGFGFVQFQNKTQAGMALKELNGKQISGRVVAVDWALPKDKFVAKQKDYVPEESMEVDNDQSAVSHSKEEDELEIVAVKEDLNNSNSASGSDDEDEESSTEAEDEDTDEGSSSDDEGGDNDDDDDDDDESASEDEEMKQKQMNAERESDVTEGRTVFIRNLPFSVEDEEIEEFFSQFGAVKYARKVIDRNTGVPRGSAFVQFSSKDGVDKCLEGSSDTTENKSGLVIGGRQLLVTLAVTKQHAGELAEKKDVKKEEKDTRNLYLAREGMIRPGTAAAKNVPAADLARRAQSDAAKRRKLADQNMFVSSTRLCLQNLPGTVTDKQLRMIVIKAAGDKQAQLTECRIMRDLNRVNTQGVGKSRGYAFCAFSQHVHALAALRHLNNNPSIFGELKRPIVEFSLENRNALEAKQKRWEKTKWSQEKMKKKNTSEAAAEHSSHSEGIGSKKRKRPFAKNQKPLDVKREQDKVARSLHKGPIGLPSHSGPKVRHKPRPTQHGGQKKPSMKKPNTGASFKPNRPQGQIRAAHSNQRNQPKVTEKPVKLKNANKKRNNMDNFDRLVASYKQKLMSSVKL